LGGLKFTVELEENGKLPFLDVILLKNRNSLDFKIYRKLTNNNRFLCYSSDHARQVKTGLIISLTDWISSICSPNFFLGGVVFSKENTNKQHVSRVVN
jgi:hypothetical protein